MSNFASSSPQAHWPGHPELAPAPLDFGSGPSTAILLILIRNLSEADEPCHDLWGAVSGSWIEDLDGQDD